MSRRCEVSLCPASVVLAQRRIVREQRDLAGVGAKDADHQVVPYLVRAEHVVRVRVLDGRDELDVSRDEIDFSLFQHVGVRL